MINDPYQFRIFAMDPGTDTLGVAVLAIDFRTGKVSALGGLTIHSGKTTNDYGVGERFYGNRYMRLENSKEALKALLNRYQPHAIVHESPFMRKFAEAYRALSECIQNIRQACFEYDPSIVIEYVDPPTAKIAVGTPRIKGVTKDDVRNALLQLGLSVEPGVDLSTWDEHTVDAGAVGYWKAKQLLGESYGKI